LGGLWALEWTWHYAETNLRCAGISGICMPLVVCIVSEISAFISLDHIVSEISAFIRTDIQRQTDMTRSTRLVILIKNVNSLALIVSEISAFIRKDGPTGR